MSNKKIYKIKHRSVIKSLRTPNKSILKKYQELTVGDYGFLKTVKYELLASFLSILPGGFGLLTRRYFYRYLFKEVGSNSLFGRNILIIRPDKIRLGMNVVIGNNCNFDIKGDDFSKITLGNSVLIGHNTTLRVRISGTIEIENNSTVGDNCIIETGARVKVGSHVMIAPYCHLIGGHRRLDRKDILIKNQPSFCLGIVIEDNVWIGSGVKILDGVKIGTGSVIGAGAVVTKDIPEYSIAAYVPAKVIKKRI